MKIIINVIDDEDILFEKCETNDFLDAEAALGRAGRHWETKMKQEANMIPDEPDSDYYDQVGHPNEEL